MRGILDVDCVRSSVALPLGTMKLEKALYILSAVLLVLGATLPLLTVSKLIFVTNQVSLVQGVFELLLEGQFLVFLIVFAFSIVLPIVKMYFLFEVIFLHSLHSEKVKRSIRLMHDFGRWAMLDVMVVAVLIVTVKLGALASVEVHSGMYIFGASVLIAMYLTQRVSNAAQRTETTSD